MLILLISYLAIGVLWLANHGWGVIAAIVWTLYVADVTLRPRIACRNCKGSGVVLKSGRRMAMCPVCKGRKHHTRLGALIWRRHRYMFRPDPEREDDDEDRETLHDKGWY